MAALITLGLLALVGLFVLFVVRWRPTYRPISAPPALNEVEIVAETGVPVQREASDRTTAMREALLASGRIPRREWAAVEPQIVFVPDDLSDVELTERLLALGGSVPDLETETGVGARERFRNLLVAQGLETWVESLGTHLAPGPFDAYRIRGRG